MVVSVVGQIARGAVTSAKLPGQPFLASCWENRDWVWWILQSHLPPPYCWVWAMCSALIRWGTLAHTYPCVHGPGRQTITSTREFCYLQIDKGKQQDVRVQERTDYSHACFLFQNNSVVDSKLDIKSRNELTITLLAFCFRTTLLLTVS